MKTAVVILSMAAAIMAEAPYHLPRPAAHAPPFGYPAAPAPPPPPSPPSPHHHYPRPQPQLQPNFIQYPPQPAITPQFIQGSGYHYQQPNIAPTYVQPAPQPQPHYHHHPPAPQPIPVGPPQVYYPQQQYAYSQPPPPTQPSLTYGQPQPYIAPAPRPELPALPIQTQPAFSAPQPRPSIQYYQPQVTQQQGYSYQQPHAQAVQYTSQIPLQAQPLSNNAVASALSSYQADSNQYSSGSVQSHSEGLDSTVVNRVQNIIKDNEHSSARNAGYVSLVSGVSLEGARPSIEISSFVQNSPLTTSLSSEQGSGSGASSSSSQSTSASAAASAPSQDYGFPAITANSHDTSSIDSSLAFLPQNKPANSYGTPQ